MNNKGVCESERMRSDWRARYCMSDSDLARPWVAIKINEEEILMRPARYGCSLADGSSDIARMDLSVGLHWLGGKRETFARFDYQKARRWEEGLCTLYAPLLEVKAVKSSPEIALPSVHRPERGRDDLR